MANILLLYNSTQTYTQAVFEYLLAFKHYSAHHFHFAHVSETAVCTVDVDAYDAIGIHYSIRLPFDQISPSWKTKITNFENPKFIFIQDEYDHTKRTHHWIKHLGISTVFTCVPEQNIDRVYPLSEFPNTTFHNVLTGYVPEILPNIDNLPKIADRDTLIAYRGRPLSPRYGNLGREKLNIGKLVKKYAEDNEYKIDIEWSEEKRIYGKNWYRFVASARATLGTESGANIFDWDGTLDEKLRQAAIDYPEQNSHEHLKSVLKCSDEDGFMNQISPRIFEAIALQTALVLFPGDYSGILEPHKHYIPLEKDGSNLRVVFEALDDVKNLDQMSTRAYQDIIVSGTYSYQTFVNFIDDKLGFQLHSRNINPLVVGSHSSPVQFGHLLPLPLSIWDIRSFKSSFQFAKELLNHWSLVYAGTMARKLSPGMKRILRPIARRLLRV